MSTGDHLDQVFDRFAEDGRCQYCGELAKVRPEPFGGRDACKPCTNQIIDGSE